MLEDLAAHYKFNCHLISERCYTDLTDALRLLSQRKKIVQGSLYTDVGLYTCFRISSHTGYRGSLDFSVVIYARGKNQS